MLKKFVFFLVLGLAISFSACTNEEGSEVNPTSSDTMVEVTIDGKTVLVDMTPPANTTKQHWVHIGFVWENNEWRSVWQDLHAAPDSDCGYLVYEGFRGFRCEPRNPIPGRG